VKLLPICLVLCLLLAAPASAHRNQHGGGPSVKVIASGLDNPRHVAVAKNGDVYVAEAGRGGDPATSKSCFDSAEGFACTGATGALTRISKHHGTWKKERVVKGLASFAPASGDSAIGPHGVFARGNDVFFTNGGPTEPTRGNPPQTVFRDPTLVSEEPISRLYGTLLKLGHHGRVSPVADIWKFEDRFNPDEELGNSHVDSNPVDVWAGRRGFLVADAGGNTVLRVGHRGIRVVNVFPNQSQPNPFGGPDVAMQAVPTGVVRGPDGAIYVSQLTGFPFPIGGARIFRIDPRTGVVKTYARGFTNAMDLAFGRDGTLYVLEIRHASLLSMTDTSGAILAVPPGGGTAVPVTLPGGTTLTEPGGIDYAGGKLYVSNHAREAGDGQVLEVKLG
jgi:DNA-binding beta-propeller fold protein YncE